MGMVDKLTEKNKGWQTNMLSYGGRVALVKLVIQYLLIHIILAVSPTSTTLKQIKRFIVDFLLGKREGK